MQFWLSLIIFWVFTCSVQAEISLSNNQLMIPDDKKNYHIEQAFGQIAGQNLFHSFGQFNIEAGETAIFSGSDQIQNIITRVTGQQASFLNGRLSSTIPNAHFYLINPNGITLGAQAELDLTGSFYVTTADFVQFADNQRFYAQPASNQILSTAPITSFGFLGQPAPITINRSLDNPQHLQLVSGQSFGLIGGDISLQGASDNNLVGLYVTEGQILLASLAAQGLVTFTENILQISQDTALGNIELSDSFTISVTGQQAQIIARANQFHITNQAAIFADGQLLDIQANQLVIENDGQILTDNYFTAPNQAGTIQIQAEEIQLNTGGHIQIFNDSLNKQGGLIDLNAQKITVAGESPNSLSNIMTRSTNSGSTGSIAIKAQQLTVTDGANISTTAYAQGQGGALTMQVSDSIIVQGESVNGYPSTISANTEGEGQAGHISIETPQLSVLDGGNLTASTIDVGKGGILQLDIGTLRVQGERQDGFPSVVDASSYGTGEAGQLIIDADTINIIDGGLAGAGTFESGDGGLVKITANKINIVGTRKDGTASMIATGTYGDEDAGDLTINAQQLNIQSGGMVATSAFAAGKGRAGDLLINVQQVNLLDNGQINANSLTSGGDMAIRAQTLYLQNSRIESQLAGELIFDNLSSGGNLQIIAANYIFLNDSQITTSSELASGNGGNLNIQTQFLIASDTSQLQARAIQGHGGNIDLDIFGLLRADPNARLFDASSELGISGETNIQFEIIIDVLYDLVTLPKTFLTTSQTFELCDNTQGQSRFAFHPYTGSKYSVFDWRPSPTSHLIDF